MDTSSATGAGNATTSDVGASSSGGSGGTAPGSTSGTTSVAGASGGSGGTALGVSGAGGEATTTSTTGATGLYGYWLVWGASGDCVDFMEYLAFFTDSQMQHIVDDQDACMSPDTWSTTYDDGTYTLDGRTLTYELDSGTRKRFDVTLGTLGSTGVLFHSVFVPAGAGVWRSDTSEQHLANDGAVESSNDVSATITFDDAIPTVGEGTCSATIAFSVNQFDVDAADGETQHDYSGSVDVPCSYVEGDRGQEITFEGLSFDAYPSAVVFQVGPLFGAGQLWMPPDGEILFANWYPKEDGIPERLR